MTLQETFVLIKFRKKIHVQLNNSIWWIVNSRLSQQNLTTNRKLAFNLIHILLYYINRNRLRKIFMRAA